MAKKKMRDSVKIPSITLEFEDKRINVFLYELIKAGNFQQALELIMMKSFHNLDFFLDGSLPYDARINEPQVIIREIETGNSDINKSVEDKLNMLTQTMLTLNEKQDTSNSNIGQLMTLLDDLTTKNNQLVSTIAHMQELMQKTEEGLSTLDRLKTSGVNLNKIIEDNTSLPEAPIPAREAPKPNRSSLTSQVPPVENLSGVEREKAEASSIIGQGFFSVPKKPDGEEGAPAFDLEAMMAKLKAGS